MKLDNVFYINLDSREDRRVSVERELDELGWKYERFAAIKHSVGIFGCGQSHMNVVMQAKERDLDYVVVLEDDAEFLNKEFVNNQIENILKSDLEYDVLLLAGNIRLPIMKNDDVEGLNNVYQVKHSWAATCYLVKKHYYDTLIDNFKEGLELMTKTGDRRTYACDAWWINLQKKDKWLIVLPRTVTQRPDFSDVEKKTVNYRHLLCDI